MGRKCQVNVKTMYIDTKRPIKQKFSKTPEKNRISDAANLVILSIFYFMTFYKGVILLL